MSTKLTSGTEINSQDTNTFSATQQHVLGEKAYSPDGRTWRYVKVGGTTLVPGNVIQSPAVTPNHVNLTPTAVSAVGDTTITLTLGNTAATANQYTGGYLIIEKGTTGAGQTLLIKSHPAASALATLQVTLDDPIQTATSGTITASLVANKYNGVIQCPVTTLTGTPVGVAVAPITNAQFGWICSRGVVGTLADGAQTVGVTSAAVPSAAAGAAKVMAATLYSIGMWCKTSIDTQITPLDLTLD